MTQMVTQVGNIAGSIKKKNRKVILKYENKQYFNTRNLSLGRLIGTTDRAQESNHEIIRKLNHMLDRVELDRPYLLRDKIDVVDSATSRGLSPSDSFSHDVVRL